MLCKNKLERFYLLYNHLLRLHQLYLLIHLNHHQQLLNMKLCYVLVLMIN